MQHCNRSTTHFRSSIIVFRLIPPARCKIFFSLQGFPHVSDNTATKGTMCLGGQGHNPGDWEAVRRKIGPPNCPAELLGFLRRIGGVVVIQSCFAEYFVLQHKLQWFTTSSNINTTVLWSFFFAGLLAHFSGFQSCTITVTIHSSRGSTSNHPNPLGIISNYPKPARNQQEPLRAQEPSRVHQEVTVTIHSRLGGHNNDPEPKSK